MTGNTRARTEACVLKCPRRPTRGKKGFRSLEVRGGGSIPAILLLVRPHPASAPGLPITMGVSCSWARPTDEAAEAPREGRI